MQRRRNKKGSWILDHLGQMILTALMIGVGIYYIWAFLLHGGGDSIKKVQTCGALTGNAGECKSFCDKEIELELPDFGCQGADNNCCILKKEYSGDVIFPTGYGGDDTTNYAINEITFSKIPTGCSKYENDATTIACAPGKSYSVEVTTTLTDIIGTVNAFAVPFIVVNSNADNVAKPGTYTGTVVKAVKPESQLKTTITISNTQAKKGSYWEIYPYVKCTTVDCQKTDTKDGILKLNTEEKLTIKFIT